MFLQCLFLAVLSISLIFFQSKYLILVDTPGKEKHKLNNNKNTPLTGGIYLFLAILANTLFAGFEKESFNVVLLLSFFLILGIYSDINKNFSPRSRLLWQIALVILLIVFLDLRINKTNVFFLDYFINNNIFNLIFTAFCMLVLLNGSNFCDGVNCNVIGYYLLVTLAIFSSGLPLPMNLMDIEIVLSIFFIFFIFNLFKKYFLGDNGAYLISIFMSIYVIEFINFNNNISSLLALNLLWYPAFENLFSIIRRSLTNTKVQVADRNHLHILIFKTIAKKNSINISNSLTGILLNIFMSIGIFSSIKFYNNNAVLISILLLNIIAYLILYFYFLLINKNLNFSKKTIRATDSKKDITNK